MKLFIDIYAGFGGASEAFVNAPGWKVIRIENNPLLADVPHTWSLNILKISLDELFLECSPDLFEEVVLWFSPPCREFSDGYNSPKSIAAREGRLDSYQPDMTLLERSIEIVNYFISSSCLNHYIIENVKGASPYFKQLLGEHRQRIGPFLLWGEFPYIDVGDFKHEKSHQDVHSSNPLRSNYKAKIPIEVSTALMKAIDGHVRLDRWIN